MNKATRELKQRSAELEMQFGHLAATFLAAEQRFRFIESMMEEVADQRTTNVRRKHKVTVKMLAEP